MENLSSVRTFQIWDYVVFGAVLLVSSLIGIYYAIQDAKRKSNNTEEYLLAKRNMHCVPVALSLTVSFMSAITILGTPAEIYNYGLMFWWLLPSFLISAVIISEIYIPIFCRLKIISCYEYLELRFNRAVRILATMAYIVETILYIGLVIFAPALALSEVTGFDLWAAVLSTGLVCTFYTTLGGLKGVIWTDVIQIFVMLAGLLAVIIQGSIRLGGFSNIWETCNQGGRLYANNVDPDPRVRHSIWTLLVGGTFLWLGMYAVSQSQVQRYLCCRTERHSKLALYLNFVGLSIVITLACMCGLVIFAYYNDCDPILTGRINRSDRLLPYLVMEIFEQYPGIPGIFVACVYSGSLSTVSTGINAMACVTVEDFIKPCTNLSDSTYCWISRGFGIIFGLLSIGMAYLASILGGVLQAAIVIFGLVGGPLLGIFTLGMIFPFANSWGAIAGFAIGLTSSSWIYMGAKEFRAPNSITLKLPVNMEGCMENVNGTVVLSTTASETTYVYSNATSSNITAIGDISLALIDIYSISYLYYSCVGFLFTIVLGLIVSLFTCGYRNAQKVHPSLIFHVFDHWTLRWLPDSFRATMRCGVRNIEEKRESEYLGVELKRMTTMAS